MKDIFESVSSSPRTKRFSATYLLVYFFITVAFNMLTRLIPMPSGWLGTVAEYAVSFVALLIEGALIFGLIRGITQKNYHFNEQIVSFAETENYAYYLIYALIKLAYKIACGFISSFSDVEGIVGTVANVLSVVMIAIELILNLYIVRLYFDKIFKSKEKLDLIEPLRDCIGVLRKQTGKFALVELVKLVVGYVAFIFGVLLTGVLTSAIGTHWAVSFIATCLVTVQFGALIYVWPVYYLYYKEIFEF